MSEERIPLWAARMSRDRTTISLRSRSRSKSRSKSRTRSFLNYSEASISTKSMVPYDEKFKKLSIRSRVKGRSKTGTKTKLKQIKNSDDTKYPKPDYPIDSESEQENNAFIAMKKSYYRQFYETVDIQDYPFERRYDQALDKAYLNLQEITAHCLKSFKTAEIKLLIENKLKDSPSLDFYTLDTITSVSQTPKNQLLYGCIRNFIVHVLSSIEEIYNAWSFDVLPVGSYPLGLKVGYPDEFDFDLVWKPGKIKSHKSQDLGLPIKLFSPNGSPLSVNLNIISLKKAIKSRIGSMIFVKDVKLHGPAVCVIFEWPCHEGHVHSISVDLIISVIHPSIHNHIRKNIPKYFRKMLTRMPQMTMVQKDPRDLYYWKPVISAVDMNIFKSLQKTMPNVSVVLRLAKVLCQMAVCRAMSFSPEYKEEISPSINTYTIKQAVLWEVHDNHDKKCWHGENNIINNLLSVFHRCIDSVNNADQNGTLPMIDVYLQNRLNVNPNCREHLLEDILLIIDFLSKLDESFFRYYKKDESDTTLCDTVIVYGYGYYHYLTLDILKTTAIDSSEKMVIYTPDSQGFEGDILGDFTFFDQFNSAVTQRFREMPGLSADICRNELHLHFAWLLSQCRYLHRGGRVKVYHIEAIVEDSHELMLALDGNLNLVVQLGRVYIKGVKHHWKQGGLETVYTQYLWDEVRDIMTLYKQTIIEGKYLTEVLYFLLQTSTDNSEHSDDTDMAIPRRSILSMNFDDSAIAECTQNMGQLHLGYPDDYKYKPWLKRIKETLDMPGDEDESFTREKLIMASFDILFVKRFMSEPR